MTIINSNQFSNIESLSLLDLSNNQISFIENNSFLNLKNLTDLNLQSNEIKIIESYVFKFTMINDLTIKDQFLTKISSYSFYQMSKLTYLDNIINF